MKILILLNTNEILPWPSFFIPFLAAVRPSLTLNTLAVFPRTKERKLSEFSLIFKFLRLALNLKMRHAVTCLYSFLELPTFIQRKHALCEGEKLQSSVLVVYMNVSQKHGACWPCPFLSVPNTCISKMVPTKR